jgi:hypothetical protein
MAFWKTPNPERYIGKFEATRLYWRIEVFTSWVERRKWKDISLTWFFACYIYIYIVFRDQDDGSDDSRIKTILDSQGRLLRRWNMMIALSCVIAVSMDPLFFYLPIINKIENNKCLRLDNGLKIIAYSLRYVTDFVNLLNISLQFICHYIDDKDSRKLGLTKRYKYFFSWYFVIDVLSILPLPQVRDTFLCFWNLNCLICKCYFKVKTANLALDPFCYCGDFFRIILTTFLK